ncbi:NAD(P)-dependent oxidoreductase [Tichowtungia aerotolerans]|uniref:Glutamyl-tRNA reductase n=1 Tax=Tichowtungia aerotolerans TaxID=2697043 RepID=A0A6P1M430_9BACT|nr:NAD(P)-dependent oxidoreductase [Tichowtungia aerotolerans]QHI68601.1 hypothetical protein GT409_03765 [Tichowtungia aerotolerans]
MNDKLNQTKSMPVSLLLDGRPCLVVGGGKVAFRKAGHLIDSGAEVTVVSPDLCDKFSELSIHHVARKFEPDDVDGMVLVFAATNDRYVNRQVLEHCRKKNILCSCVDGNWAQSDFTTPAIARHGSLTLTVATGGQSCRQAKMVKDSLARHLEMIETVELVVVGTDHHHLSLEQREPFHLTGPRSGRTGFMLMQLWGVHEFMILNTCNRVELIAVVSHETAHNGILRHVLGFDKLSDEQFYIHRGAEAFGHLCLVTAGMLSQTPGESHIAAQIKQTFDSARESGWAGSMMQEWVSSLLHVSKHIQTEIAPGLRFEEIEDLVLSYLEDRQTDLSEKKLLILGAGMVGQGLVANSFPKVGQIVWCYHRNRPELSRHWKNVELCDFNSIKDRLGDADIVVSAADAPGHLLHSGHAPFFDHEKEVTLIDLGMPRNIDPALKELSPEPILIDLDGLKQWHRSRMGNLNESLEKCRRIIGEHQEQYERIINSFQGRHA